MAGVKNNADDQVPDHAGPDPVALPPGGVRVPLMATFLGVRSVPWLALGHNSLYPLLVLHPEHVEYRMFIRCRRDYREIEKVEAMTTIGTRNIEFHWLGSGLTFTANIRSERWRLWVLNALVRRGVAVGPGAQRLMTSDS